MNYCRPLLLPIHFKVESLERFHEKFEFSEDDDRLEWENSLDTIPSSNHSIISKNKLEKDAVPLSKILHYNTYKKILEGLKCNNDITNKQKKETF